MNNERLNERLIKQNFSREEETPLEEEGKEEDIYAPVDRIIEKVKSNKFESTEEYAKQLIKALIDIAIPTTPEEAYKGEMFSSPTRGQKIKKLLE